MQRRTATRLLRPFPLGLRFSGKNMSPLPCWLAGAHSVALNMSNPDLAAQLHFALFDGSGGYVLKPKEMRTAPSGGRAGAISAEADGHFDEYWPPPRAELHRTTIEILSLHNLPKVRSRVPLISHELARLDAPALTWCLPVLLHSHQRHFLSYCSAERDVRNSVGVVAHAITTHRS